MLEFIKITISENGGNKKYGYEFFKEGFEEWAEEFDALHTEENLREYLNECGYKVIEIKELD